MEPKNGGPAFPSEQWVQTGPGHSDGNVLRCGGMSLRDYFAAHAPQPPQWWKTIDAHDSWNEYGEAQYYRWRWHYADSMLAERNK